MEKSIHHSMKILHLNSSDMAGGAARAAYRLFKGEQTAGLDVRMLVQRKLGSDPAVFEPCGLGDKLRSRLAARYDRWPLRLMRHLPEDFWSLCWLPSGMEKIAIRMQPDIVHLHWIGGGTIPVGKLEALGRPMVWTMHDTWAFTGGCHYPGDCGRFRERCGCCPQLASSSEKDPSRWTWNRKHNAWSNLDLTLVSPSRWLANQARESSLFRAQRIEVIPNGIDTAVFRPLNRQLARQALNLPATRKVILCGAMDLDVKRKGFSQLLEALQLLPEEWRQETLLMVLGPAKSVPSPATMVYTGMLHDDLSLALAYSAADVFVLPSLQENLSNMVMEAMACGLPVVAFSIGGTDDMVEHKNNGYLAGAGQAEELAQGIRWVLESPERRGELADQARAKACREFAMPVVAARYQELYQEICLKQTCVGISP